MEVLYCTKKYEYVSDGEIAKGLRGIFSAYPEFADLLKIGKISYYKIVDDRSKT